MAKSVVKVEKFQFMVSFERRHFEDGSVMTNGTRVSLPEISRPHVYFNPIMQAANQIVSMISKSSFGNKEFDAKLKAARDFLTYYYSEDFSKTNPK